MTASAAPKKSASETSAEFRAMTSDTSFFGHPKGLSTLFFTELWERFSFYGIRPLLVLFMTAALTSGGFGFDRPKASAIVGIYAASVYLASLPGGWIADRWLGLQRSVWYGGVLIALGHLSIALSAVFLHSAFFLGLVLIVLGTGLLKPNISAMVGSLYPDGGSRRDAAFSIFYMGINFGALVSPLVTGYLGERVGWHWGFGAAGVGMLVGLVWLRARRKNTLGPIGGEPTTGVEERTKVRNYTIAGMVVVIVGLALAMTGVVTIDPIAVANSMKYIISGIAIVYFLFLFLFAGLTGDEKKRMAVIMALFVGAVVFWAAFEQAPTSLNLFAKDFTDRNVFGWEMPTLWLQSVNSVFIVTLAPVMAWIWVTLGKRKLDPSSPAKFAGGLLLTGLGFWIMVAAAKIVITGGPATRVSAWWLIGSYMMQSVGELMISPVGLSSMTALAPKKYVGQMMGVWFMATSLGNLIAGLVGGQVNPENLAEMPSLFNWTAISLFGGAAVLAMLVIPIRRMIATTAEGKAQ